MINKLWEYFSKYGDEFGELYDGDGPAELVLFPDGSGAINIYQTKRGYVAAETMLEWDTIEEAVSLIKIFAEEIDDRNE